MKKTKTIDELVATATRAYKNGNPEPLTELSTNISMRKYPEAAEIIRTAIATSVPKRRGAPPKYEDWRIESAVIMCAQYAEAGVPVYYSKDTTTEGVTACSLAASFLGTSSQYFYEAFWRDHRDSKSYESSDLVKEQRKIVQNSVSLKNFLLANLPDK